jgi:hypothetical protein
VRRGYPGWRIVWALAVTETISYGVLYYSFAAFLLPMQHSLGFSQTTLTGAFSVSVQVTGAGAVPAGAWLDRTARFPPPSEPRSSPAVIRARESRSASGSRHGT